MYKGAPWLHLNIDCCEDNKLPSGIKTTWLIFCGLSPGREMNSIQKKKKQFKCLLSSPSPLNKTSKQTNQNKTQQQIQLNPGPALGFSVSLISWLGTYVVWVLWPKPSVTVTQRCFSLCPQQDPVPDHNLSVFIASSFQINRCNLDALATLLFPPVLTAHLFPVLSLSTRCCWFVDTEVLCVP